MGESAAQAPNFKQKIQNRRTASKWGDRDCNMVLIDSQRAWLHAVSIPHSEQARQSQRVLWGVLRPDQSQLEALDIANSVMCVAFETLKMTSLTIEPQQGL